MTTSTHPAEGTHPPRPPQPISGVLHTRTAQAAVIRDIHGVSRAWHGRIPEDARPGDYLTAQGVPTLPNTFTVHGVSILARNADLTVAFLSHFVKGVGPATAAKLAASGGPGLLDALAREEFPPGTPAKLERALRDACRKPEREQVSALFLLGLHPTHCLSVVNAWGESAVARFAADPFDALTLGVPFSVLDRAHGHLGGTPDAPGRHRALAVEFLRSQAAQEGHVCLHEATVHAQLMDTHALTFPEAQAATRENPQVTAYGPLLYLPHLHDTEEQLARHVTRLLAQRVTALPAVTPDGVNLSREQRQAVTLALQHPLTILTGGPGTGKSTTVRAVAHSFLSAGLKLMLAAPTGKAASRLADATGLQAQTLHRLLGANRQGWTYHTGHQLPAQVVIVDECSMIAQDLLLSLLSAVPTGTRVVLVGDVEQLPPIDAGMPLAALMENVPVAHLTTVYRQAAGSPIVQLAYAMLEGEDIDFTALDGLPFIQTSDAARVAAIAAEHDAQILTPMRKGPLGTEALNAACRTRLRRAGGLNVTGGTVSEGDPVVCTRNLYDIGVMNGMTGTVTAVTGEDDGTVEVTFDHGVVAFSGSRRAYLMPAFAMTIHRSQGSEWGAVAVALHDSHAGMLVRTLAYTAVTRAKGGLVLLGSPAAWARAVKTQAPGRLSGLTTRLNS